MRTLTTMRALIILLSLVVPSAALGQGCTVSFETAIPSALGYKWFEDSRCGGAISRTISEALQQSIAEPPMKVSS